MLLVTQRGLAPTVSCPSQPSSSLASYCLPWCSYSWSSLGGGTTNGGQHSPLDWAGLGEFRHCSIPPSPPNRMRFRAELASNDWIIDYNDVVLSAGGAGAASSVAFRSMVSMASDQMKKK